MKMLSQLVLILLVVLLMVLAALWLKNRVMGDRVTDPAPEQRAEMQRLRAPQALPGAGAATLPAGLPLELRLPWHVYFTELGWLVGAGVCLLLPWFGFESAWQRALAWVTALGALLVLGLVFSTVRNLWLERLVVSAEFVEHWRGDQRLHRHAWAEVAQARLVPQTIDDQVGTTPAFRPSRKKVTGWQLQFEGAGGRPLFAITAPLRSAQDYQTLLDALPMWTGRPMLREQPKL